MVRDLDLYSLGLVLMCLTSAIITLLSERLRVGGGALLHVANIFGLLFVTGYATVVMFKKVIEYNGSIHQLKRWTQELMTYEFVCIHRPNKTMKDVDGVCRHIDPLTYRYLVDTAAMRSDDIMLQSFANNFDVCFDVLVHVVFHTMMLSLITSLSPLFSLVQYFIITQFGSLLTCIHSSQEHLLFHFRGL